MKVLKNVKTKLVTGISILALAFTVMVAPVKKADAVVATLIMAPLGVPAAVTATVVGLFGIGGGFFTYSLYEAVANNRSTKPFTVSTVLGISAMVAGIVVMDKENGQDISFTKINSQQEAFETYGMTKNEFKAYNENYEELNSALQATGAKLQKLGNKATPKDALKIWRNFGKAYENQAAFSAGEKIAAKIVQSLE